ncbi:hypothetical protein EDB19DRAFT_1827895 [Suillus lakei]|nr:hypothetical protein EDB19DRAFT_1827895 [Suillus lakei]
MGVSALKNRTVTLLTWLVCYYKSTHPHTAHSSAFDPRGTAGVSKKLIVSTNTISTNLDHGTVYADAQNLARTLMELPANVMTPTRTFLSVTQRTDQSTKFLKIGRRVPIKAPLQMMHNLLLLWAKAVTFDSR